MLALAKPRGVLKTSPEDFVVHEKLHSGEILKPSFESNIQPYSGSGAQYTEFLLSKREIGAEPVYREIADQLGVRRAQITDHGRKDQYAITSQLIVVEGAYNPHFAHEKIALQYRGVAPDRLYNGRHPNGRYWGNQFSVLMRTEAVHPPEGVRFLNLFGAQRFGDGRHMVGRYLLEGDYQQALALMETSSMSGAQLRSIAQRHGLDAMHAMLHPEFRGILEFKVLQWQSHLWNSKAYHLRQFHNESLPMWSEEHAHLYEGLWNPTHLNEEFVGALHHFSRPLWTQAVGHTVSEEDDGFRHRFALRSGSFATVFLGSLYDMEDKSRKGLDPQ